MNRAIVEDEHNRLLRTIRRQAILRVDLFQKRNEIGTALAPTGAHDQFTRGPVEQTKHRHLGGLAGRGNAQIRALLGPGMGQIGMGERFGLIAEQEHDIALACAFRSLRRRPARSTACASWRPFRVWRGRRQRKSPFGATRLRAVSARCVRRSASRSRRPAAARSSWGDPPPIPTVPPRPPQARARP